MSVYDIEKRSRKKTGGYPEIITEEDLFPPKVKKKKGSKCPVEEYGAAAIPIKMGKDIHLRVKTVFFNKPDELMTFVILRHNHTTHGGAENEFSPSVSRKNLDLYSVNF